MEPSVSSAFFKSRKRLMGKRIQLWCSLSVEMKWESGESPDFPTIWGYIKVTYLEPDVIHSSANTYIFRTNSHLIDGSVKVFRESENKWNGENPVSQNAFCYQKNFNLLELRKRYLPEKEYGWVCNCCCFGSGCSKFGPEWNWIIKWREEEWYERFVPLPQINVVHGVFSLTPPLPPT